MTAACVGNREARLGQRSAFSKPCQGAAEKAASATRKTRRTAQCNSDDRRLRQKQGGEAGAVLRVPFYSARLAKSMKNAQTKTTVRVDGGSVIA